MLDDRGLMETRTRDIKLRLLSEEKLTNESAKWKAINVALPEVILLLVAGMLTLYRRRKYAR